jgi:hypothetical protein
MKSTTQWHTARILGLRVGARRRRAPTARKRDLPLHHKSLQGL